MKLAIDKDIPYISTFTKDLCKKYDWEIFFFKDSDLSNDLLKDCEAIFIRSTTYIDSDLIENTPIKYIGSATSGFDHIDNNYLNWNSIDRKCFIAKGCNSFAVVNYVLACLGFLIKLKNFSSADSVGIIGYGNIGSLLSKTLDILSIKNFCYDPYKSKYNHKKNLKDILNCKVVSVHASYSKEGIHPSYKLINKSSIQDCRLNYLINTSRGEIVDEDYVLNNQSIDYIGDVWTNEPNCSKRNIKKALLATPHIAGYSNQAKIKATQLLLESFCDFFDIDLNANQIRNTDKLFYDFSNSHNFIDNFPYKFFQQLFDIEQCSKKFKDQLLRKDYKFSDIRKSFKYIDDFSIYNFEDIKINNNS